MATDGAAFTSEEVTLTDLQKHRDPRGVPVGVWTYTLNGQGQRFQLVEDETITNAKGVFELGLDETVPSASAPPLLYNTSLGPGRQRFQFDLFREGTFIANVTSASPSAARDDLKPPRDDGPEPPPRPRPTPQPPPPPPIPQGLSMRLLDPDHTQVAGTASKQLRYQVDLAALGKSRDSAGRPRYWTLEVAPQGGVVVGSPQVSATVIGSGRISTGVLHNRIAKMLGPRGDPFVRIYGENTGGEALCRLVITDVVAAETIDMHKLLEKPLGRDEDLQDDEVDPTDVNAHTVYTLGRRSEDLGYGTRLDVSTLKIQTIDVAIGPGHRDRLGPTIPAVKLTLRVAGEVKVTLGPFTVATAKIHDGTVEIEVGIALDPNGTPRVATWVPAKPLDIDISWKVVLAAGVVGLALVGLGLRGFTELLEREINDKFASTAREFFDDPALAPRILMMIFGAHLTYLPIRFEGDDIVFDYIAPLEPDPTP